MRVLEFGFGIPPKIKKVFTDKKGTEFTLNALPLGGFVRIDGEDVTKPSAFENGAFMSKSLWKRLLVLVAWVVMNLLLAWGIFTALFMMGTRPLTALPIDIGATNSYFLPSLEESIDSGFVKSDWVYIQPLTGSIAEAAGLRTNDIIVWANGEKVISSQDVIDKISQNTPLELEVLRIENNEKIFQKISVTPEHGKIWIAISDALKINSDFVTQYSFSDAIVAGAKETYYSSLLTFKLVKNTLWNLFFAENAEVREEAKNNLSGPIGAWNAFVSMVEQSVPATIIILFIALLSVNLAVMNILPFPALDGGRMLFTTIYSILLKFGFSREKILKYESVIHSTGFILLMIFMLYVAWLDIFRLFQ